MARVIGSTPGDRWEREVLNQFKVQLPDAWLVLSGVSWSRQGPNDGWRYVRDGQADLVVLVPRLGMVVVEVKGSRVFRIGEDGRWYRTDPATGVDVGGRGAAAGAGHPEHARARRCRAAQGSLGQVPWLVFLRGDLPARTPRDASSLVVRHVDAGHPASHARARRAHEAGALGARSRGLWSTSSTKMPWRKSRSSSRAGPSRSRRPTLRSMFVTTRPESRC